MARSVTISPVRVARAPRRLRREVGFRPTAELETVRRISRNVKRSQSGDMCLRWTAAGMLEAERRFRRIIGHTDLAKLALAVKRDVAAKAAIDHLHTPITTSAPEVVATSA